jgi:hypothetical protein
LKFTELIPPFYRIPADFARAGVLRCAPHSSQAGIHLGLALFLLVIPAQAGIQFLAVVACIAATFRQ